MATTAPYTKPLPQMEPEARPYWEHLKNHQMHIQKCQACSQFFFPPKEFCPHCLAAEVAWTPVSGKGPSTARSPCTAPTRRPTRARFPTISL